MVEWELGGSRSGGTKFNSNPHTILKTEREDERNTQWSKNGDVDKILTSCNSIRSESYWTSKSGQIQDGLKAVFKQSWDVV